MQVISKVFRELLPPNKLNWDDFISKLIGIYKEQIFFLYFTNCFIVRKKIH